MIHRPTVYNMTEDNEAYGFRQTTEVMCEQLTMIDQHNSKLPPRKRDKESLPEISSTNVNAKYMVKRDPKKPDQAEYIRKYANIGFVDAAMSVSLDNKGGVAAFSITN